MPLRSVYPRRAPAQRVVARVPRGVAVLGVLGLFTHSPATAAPKFVVPRMEVEIGDLLAGETAEAEFVIENTGTEPLQLTHVGTSCGCTTTNYPKTLAPGEKGTIKAQLTSNALWSGRVQKEITVKSNDPETPLLTLHLIAQMRPLFTFSPPNPVVTPYKKGAVIRQVVMVSAGSDAGAKVTGVGTPPPDTEVRLLPTEASDPPGTARVEITVHPPQQGGDFTSHITLQTSHPKVQTVPLILSLLSEDAITVQPRAIYWTGLGAEPSGEATRAVTVMKRSSPFRILTAETGNTALRAEIDVTASGASTAGAGSERFHEITLRYAGSLPKGTTEGKLRITTDDPDSPRLEIPYQLFVP